MHRIVILVLACVLVLGCATTRVEDDALAGDIQSMIEEAIEKPRLENYGIQTEAFESMIQRIIIAGYEVDDPDYGKVKSHWTEAVVYGNKGEEYKCLFMIARSPTGFIVTIAKDMSTGETVVFLDRDEDGIPETVNVDGRGHAKVKDYDLRAYAKVIIALLQVEVYYPPCDEDCKEQMES